MAFEEDAEVNAKLTELAKSYNKNKDEDEDDSWFVKFVLGIIGIGFVVFIFAAFIVYGVFSNGIAGMYLWEWFLVPLGVSKISLLHAVGFAALCRLFTHENSLANMYKEDDLTSSQKLSKIIIALLLPWATLLFGYIIHRLMT